MTGGKLRLEVQQRQQASVEVTVTSSPSLKDRQKRFADLYQQDPDRVSGPSGAFSLEKSYWWRFEKSFVLAFVDVVQMYIKLLPPGLLLEVGTGMGHIASYPGNLMVMLYRMGWSSISVDFCKPVIKEARRKLRNSFLANGVQLSNVDIYRKIKFGVVSKLESSAQVSPASVQVILDCRCTIHVPQSELRRAINEFKSLLVPGGIVIVCTPLQDYNDQYNPEKGGQPQKNRFTRIPSLAELRENYDPLLVEVVRNIPYFPGTEWEETYSVLVCREGQNLKAGK